MINKNEYIFFHKSIALSNSIFYPNDSINKQKSQNILYLDRVTIIRIKFLWILSKVYDTKDHNIIKVVSLWLKFT